MASNTYTLLKVVKLVGFRVGDLKDSIDDLTNPDPAIEFIVECVNRTIRTMNLVKGLRRNNDRYIFETLEPIAEASVDSISAADPAVVTASAATWVTDGVEVGMAFKVDADGAEYRIAAVTETTITLDGPYVGTLPVTTAITVAQDRYSLPATFSDIDNAAYDGPATGTIDIRFPGELDRQRYSQRATTMNTARPSHLSVYDRDSNNNWMVEFDPFPDDQYRIILRTQKASTTLTTSDGATIVPVDDEDIDALMDGATAAWKDKDTAGTFDNWTKTGLAFHATFSRKKTDQSPQLIPDDTTRRFRSIGSGAAGGGDGDFAI